jgi:BNR repeat-like domain
MRRFGWPLAAAMAFALTGAAMAQEGGLPAHPPPGVKAAQHVKELLGPSVKMLSQGAANFVHLAALWQKLQTVRAVGAGGAGAAHPIVSHPYLKATRFSGGVESESSTAWCGANAVIAYNDSGSFTASNGGKGLLAWFGLAAATQGWTFSGYGISTNADTASTTFTDKGFAPAGAINTFNEGDPVTVCGSASNFYLSNLFEDFSTAGPSGCGYSEVAIQASTDGGSTFGSPSPAASYDACYYFLDKDWMAISPNNASTLVITYTNFNLGNYGPYNNDCGNAGADIEEVDIEAVMSTDGGSTWSSPTIVAFQCTGSTGAFLQGSSVAIDPSGNIFVAYENFAANYFTREIDIALSTDNGASFGAPVKVTAVKPAGDGWFFFGLQGFIRDFDFPSLAIGRPGAPNAGELFLVWNDGNRRVYDQWQRIVQYATGYGDAKYGFTNAMFTASTDHGATWSTPLRLNAFVKAWTDHFQPTVAADSSGTLDACWYDRSRFSLNYKIARDCATSTDNGATWSAPSRLAVVGNSVVNQDLMIAYDYMGDYDELTSDYTGANPGFLGGFLQTLNGAQNVVATR